MPARSLILLAALLLCGCPTDVENPSADRDGDGHERPADCNDDDASVHPGAEEVCDDRDNDCDGVVDAGNVIGGRTWYRDQDADGHGSETNGTVEACDGVDGYLASDDDCDDDDPNNFPGNPEVCDGQDNDCDAGTVAGEDESDGDNDGAPACDDCDDTDPDRYPDNEEVCDGIDNDCDGNLGNDKVGDNDIDGFDSCVDCDDNDSEVNPDAEEQCDGKDNDCNDLADFGGDPAAEQDADLDGFIACAECDDSDMAVRPGIQEVCDGVDTDCSGEADYQGQPEVDVDLDGFWSCDDCDDDAVDINSDAAEICDGLDNDCNGLSDFDPSNETDGDNDGFPSCNDCLDGDPLSYPGAPEVCDGTDNDCDGTVDVGTIAADLDGFGDRIELPAIALGAAMTVEMWVWLDNLLLNGNPQERALMHRAGAAGEDDLLLAATETFDWDGEVWMGSAVGASAGATAAVMQWYHLALTYDGAALKLYVDGVEVGSTPSSAGLAWATAGAWTLGARDENGLFVDEMDGMIDEVRIWNVARTATEIDTARCTPLDGTEPGLIAYLPLDADLDDLTGNGNGGTAVGDALLLPF